MWFRYNPQIIFYHFFCKLNLVVFLALLLSTYGQVQIKCDEMPKNVVSQFMKNLCPFCAAEFVDPKNVMVILLTHISFRKNID